MAITTINNTLFCKRYDAVHYACVNGISEKILFTYNNNTMLNFCKMFLITENSPSNKESTRLLQEKLSNIDYSRIKSYQMCGKIHFENYKYATYNNDTGARMSLTGVGCRLQTCSRLASERFNSAFCAILCLYILAITPIEKASSFILFTSCAKYPQSLEINKIIFCPRKH